MLSILKKQTPDKYTSKKQICITGILASILRPGAPALYLYRGELIRTSTVQAILEAAPDYVRFETLNTIYTIAFDTLPDQAVKSAA